MPAYILIINNCYLTSYHCIIYRQFLSSPSGVLVPWHLTSSDVVGRQPFHLKPEHALGTDREMNENKQPNVSSPSRLSLYFHNTDTYAWSIGTSARAISHQDLQARTDHLTVSVKALVFDMEHYDIFTGLQSGLSNFCWSKSICNQWGFVFGSLFIWIGLTDFEHKQIKGLHLLVQNQIVQKTSHL